MLMVYQYLARRYREQTCKTTDFFNNSPTLQMTNVTFHMDDNQKSSLRYILAYVMRPELPTGYPLLES